MPMQTPSEAYDEILATLTLSRLQGLTQSRALELIAHYGSAAAVLDDSTPADSQWAQLIADTSALTQAREAALQELDFCEAHHISVLPCTSPDYPQLLQMPEVSDRPLQLFSCSSTPVNRRHIISVVGTRNISEYGKELCQFIIRDLAKMMPDVLIISGLAYGVDIHVHRAALVNNVDTMAVLAHGLDRIYPRYHRETAHEMVHHGGLLTEYFIHTIPDKGKFIRRNRIVAGMSAATLVIESAEHGGSLITAKLARSYKREVMAFPGRVTDAASVGCNRIIREKRATLVTSAADIVEQLGWQPVTAAPAAEPSLFPTLTTNQEKVANVLRQADSVSIDQIVQRTQLKLAQVTDLLFDLEEMSIAKRLPGNRYRATSMCG